MTRKNSLPKFPDSYLGRNADEYDEQQWMERNQKKTTLRCIEFLNDEKLGLQEIISEEVLVLDMGCGTGFSSEVLLEHGFRVVGVDILEDMLVKALEKRKQFKLNDLSLILGDINHLPFRESTIDHAISISAYNFIITSKEDFKEKEFITHKTANSLRKTLKKKGKIIIEFYPQNEKDLALFTNSFRKNGFYGFIIKDNPHQKGGKSFLMLKKE